jgi:hypothetical protein
MFGAFSQWEGVAPPALADALTSAATYAAEEKSSATRRAYRSDWVQFSAWCESAKPAKQEKLIESGLISIEPQWGRASAGRVSVKVF